jgi:AAA15 family ATPase/GTPase
MKKRFSFNWRKNLLGALMFLLVFGGIISPSFAQEREYLEGFYAVTRSDNQIYIFNFNKDGTVIVTEKNSEDKDFKELKKYELSGNTLTLHPIWDPGRIDYFYDVDITKKGRWSVCFFQSRA